MTSTDISDKVTEKITFKNRYLRIVISSSDTVTSDVIYHQEELSKTYSYVFYFTDGFVVTYEETNYPETYFCGYYYTPTYGSRDEKLYAPGDTLDECFEYYKSKAFDIFVPEQKRYVYCEQFSHSFPYVDYLYDRKKNYDLVKIITWNEDGENGEGYVKTEFDFTLERYNRWSTIFRGIVLFKIMAKKRKELLMEKLYAPGGKGMMRCAEEFACCTMSKGN